MIRKAGFLLAVALLASAPAASASDRNADCRAETYSGIADLRIVQATAISANSGFAPPFADAVPLKVDFCRLEGVIEREIGFEMWLPARQAWNTRLLTGGVGGQAGAFNYRELARAVSRGYAGASTDAGHKASDRHWLLNRPDRAENYAHRANHLLAVKAREVLQRAYGRRPSHAFFIGCSGGGRQALTEVQRYPRDYDGVIAGAPGVNTPAMSARRLWEMHRHSAWGQAMPANVWRLALRGAIDQCDRLDGIADGVLDDPRRCGFDPASLLCKPGQTSECLNDAQVAAVRLLQAPLQDENGRRLDQGLLPSVAISPVPMPEPFTPGPSYLATVLFADGVHGNPDWDARQFSLARDLPAIDRIMNLHADNPAIEPFLQNGGKLILYQGWDDPLVPAQSTLAYFDALTGRFGKRLDGAVRLFMAPGVDHCRGGHGPDLFGGAGGDAPRVDADHDMLSALERWVLQGKSPRRIVASHVEQGRVVRTRPLCAWPQHAVYRGKGDTDLAASFVCRKD